MTEKKRVYNRIKAVLVEKRKSNVDLAAHLNKGKDAVSRYMRNEVQPPISVLFQIADYLKVDARELIVSSLDPPEYIED